jgi:hypothetical protein
MARTTPEHKRTIDALDAVITFSYLYEWQMSQNKEIDKLMELYRSIVEHIEANRGEFSFPEELGDPLIPKPIKFVAGMSVPEGFDGPSTIEHKEVNNDQLSFPLELDRGSIENEVIDGLYFAVKNDQQLEGLSFTDSWVGKYDVCKITKTELMALHQKHFDGYLSLIRDTFNELARSLPDQVKPYLTVRQVKAVLELKYSNVKNTFTAPVQIDLLAAVIHQFFLCSSSNGNSGNEAPLAFDKLIYEYWDNAAKDLCALIRYKRIVGAVTKFIGQAREINLQIDDYYRWSIICMFPLDYQALDYQKLLSWYVEANDLQLINDALYQKERRVCSPSWREFKRGNMQWDASYYRPIHYRHNWVGNFIFDSKRHAITIDEKQRQNCAVLAIYYDEPIVDLEDKLFAYARHLSYLAKENIEMRSRMSNVTDFENGANAYQGWDNYKRCAITNSGSILKSICSLIILKRSRSERYQDRSNKHLCADVCKLLVASGFKYSAETVNSVRKCAKMNAETVAKNVLGKL